LHNYALVFILLLSFVC